MVSPCGALRSGWKSVARRRAAHYNREHRGSAKAWQNVEAVRISDSVQERKRWREGPKWPGRRAAVGGGDEEEADDMRREGDEVGKAACLGLNP